MIMWQNQCHLPALKSNWMSRSRVDLRPETGGLEGSLARKCVNYKRGKHGSLATKGYK